MKTTVLAQLILIFRCRTVWLNYAFHSNVTELLYQINFVLCLIWVTIASKILQKLSKKTRFQRSPFEGVETKKNMSGTRFNKICGLKQRPKEESLGPPVLLHFTQPFFRFAFARPFLSICPSILCFFSIPLPIFLSNHVPSTLLKNSFHQVQFPPWRMSSSLTFHC